MPLATMEATGWGFPDLPVVVVPHPVATLPDEQLEEIGRSLYDKVLAGLTQPAS